MEIESNCPHCQALNVSTNTARAFIFPLEMRTVRDVVSCNNCRTTYSMVSQISVKTEAKLISGETRNGIQ